MTLNKLVPFFHCSAEPWTSRHPLAGGDIETIEGFTAWTRRRYPWLAAALLERYVHTYGSALKTVLGSAQSPKDLGQHFGDGLYEAEVDYLCQKEWAATPEDVLWRRTKLGLWASPETVRNLTQWFGSP